MTLTFVTILTLFLSSWRLSYTVQNDTLAKSNNTADYASHKLYLYVNGDPYAQLVIGTTRRPSHQIISYILKELLTSQLNYRNVTLRLINDANGLNVTLRSLSQNDINDYPETMVNMEVWQPPGFHEHKLTDTYHIAHAGPLGPIVSPGLFVSRVQVQDFWDSYNVTIDHWRYFTRKYSTSYIGSDASRYSSKDGKYKTVMCSTYFGCSQLLFLNSQESVVSHVIDYINTTRLYITPHILSSARTLNTFFNSTTMKKRNLSLIYSWYPNEITLKHQLSKVMTSCDYAEQSSYSLCSYLQAKHLHKWVWKNLSSAAPYAYDLITNVTFSQKDYEQFLRKLSHIDENDSIERKQYYYREIAKDWIAKNPHIWKKWMPHVPEKIELTIAGLFPVHGPRRIKRIVSLSENVVRYINKRLLLNRPYKFKLEVYNVSSDDQGSVLEAYNRIIFNCKRSRRLVGIILATWSDVTAPVVELSSRYKIPIICSTIERITKAISTNDLKYFFRISPDEADYAKYLTSAFRALEWKRLSLFHQDNDPVINKQDFDQLEIIRDIKINENELSMNVVKKALMAANEDRTRIFVVKYKLEGTGLILCAAAKLKMTPGNGYVWIISSLALGSELIEQFVNFKLNIKKNGCTDTEANDILATIFSLSCHRYDSIRVSEPGIRKLINEVFPFLKATKLYDLDYHMIYYYTMDSIYTLFYALNKLIGNTTDGFNRYSINQNKYLNILSNSHFAGTSGEITFTKENVTPSNWKLYVISRVNDNNSNALFGRSLIIWDAKNISELNGTLKPILQPTSAIYDAFPNKKKPSDGSYIDCNWLYFGPGYSCEFRKNMTIGIIVISTVLCLIFVFVSLYCLIRWYIKVVHSRYPQPFAELLEVLADYEIPRRALLLQYPLGQGAFGTVYYGEMRTEGGTWTGIAAKVLREGASSQERREFLCEAIKMRDFKHANVMTIIGVVTTDPHFVNVMEFMLLGDLRKYLLTRHHVAKTDPQSQDIHPLTLTSMALDIARGLEYLQNNKLVHRDLACRNCLVDKEYHVKISDFGMTRRVDDRKTYYRFEHPGILPVRWMAPESIQSGLFNYCTDVWSYGVVLYEIVTFGNQPYRGRTNEEVIDSLKRYSDSLVSYLVKPEERIPELFELMRMCWSFRPEERPNVSYVIGRLEVYPECVRPCLDESPPDPGETHPRCQGLDRCTSIFTGVDGPIGRGNRGVSGVGVGNATVTSNTSFVRMISSGSRSSCDRTRFASGNRVDTDLRHCDSVGRVNNIVSNSFTNSIASRLGLIKDNPNSRWYAGGNSGNYKPYRHTCSQEFLSYSRHHSGDQEISTVSDPHGYQVEYDPLMLNAVRSIAVNAVSNVAYNGIHCNSAHEGEHGSSIGRDDDDLDTDQQTLLNTGKV